MTRGEMVTTQLFRPKSPLQGERRVVFRDPSWAAYRQIYEAVGQNRSARLIFDQGTLEITMPLEEQETAKEWISLLIRNWVILTGRKLKTLGSTTLDREDLSRSAEPDNAFYSPFAGLLQQLLCPYPTLKGLWRFPHAR